MGHLENCWSQLESLIQQKIRDSAQVLEDLARVENQLKDAREWVEEQRPTLTSVLKTSPPPDMAQNFLFDHLSVCVELEARQQLLGHAVSEAQAVAARLGLSEKRGLHELVEQAQAEVEALGAQVAQRRKYLSKVKCSFNSFSLIFIVILSFIYGDPRCTSLARPCGCTII